MAYKNKRDPRQLEAMRAWYRRNKHRVLDSNTRKRQRIRELARTAKTKPCADCKVSYPFYVMDFDHRVGTRKIFEPARLASNGSFARFQQEIEKCDVVCANCHRERTHARKVATPAGFEPATSKLGISRSIQLSYGA